MNAREQARYDLHLVDIKSYQRRARFWRMINSICQIIFFWNIVAMALELAQRYTTESVPSLSPFFTSLIDVIGPITLYFTVASAFAFFFMIWTGIVRSKWEGKLTRATAYCLSFLSNIEHREFMKMEADELLKRRRAKAMTNPEFREKLDLLQKARDSGKMSNVLFQKNVQMLEETYGK
jgi:hypothetical protein